MRRDTAVRVLSCLRGAITLLDRANDLVREECERDEYQRYIKVHADVLDALMPILNHVHLEYPDLDVDKVTVDLDVDKVTDK